MSDHEQGNYKQSAALWRSLATWARAQREQKLEVYELYRTVLGHVVAPMVDQGEVVSSFVLSLFFSLQTPRVSATSNSAPTIDAQWH